MSIVDKILSLPSPQLNHWGYWVILFSALLEATPVFGLLMPGQLIVILGGFLAKIGVLEIGDVLFVAIVGAVCGDLIGYLLGKKYGIVFLTKYGRYFFFTKEHYEKVKVLINNHAGKTLIVGRFNSLTRAIAPFVAGATNVSFLKLIVYDFIGGVGWSVTFVFIGYIFGKGYKVVYQYIGSIAIAVIIFSIFVVYVYRFINKHKHILIKK